MSIFITPEGITPEQLKKKRKALGLTQKEFAELIGMSKPTIERWEASDKIITGPVVQLLQLLTADYIESIKPDTHNHIYADKDALITLKESSSSDIENLELKRIIKNILQK